MASAAAPGRPLVDVGLPLLWPGAAGAVPSAVSALPLPRPVPAAELLVVEAEPEARPEPEWQPEAAAEPRHAPGRRRARRAGRRVLEHVTTFAVLAAVLVFCALVAGPRTGAYRTTTMLTGSMEPAIPRGALLVTVPVPVAELAPGDVVTFEAPLPGRPVVSHRLVEVVEVAGHPALRTKGDANAAADPWLAAPEGDRAWVVRAVVPAAGSAVRVLRTPGPRLVLTVGLPVLLAGWGLLLVWRDPDEEQP